MNEREREKDQETERYLNQIEELCMDVAGELDTHRASERYMGQKGGDVDRGCRSGRGATN